MQLTWKKYLIFSGIVSAILGFVLPELINYYTWFSSSPPNLEKQQMDINIYGLMKLWFLNFSFWFSVCFGSFIILGFLISHFRKNNNELT